jgi:hypothetical protein
MTRLDNGTRETIQGLVKVLLSVMWWVSVSALLFLHVLPSVIKLYETSWAESGLNDPFLTYATDGASLALGTGIYMTNHPGTPLHELYAGMTKLIQWSLAASSDNTATFGNDQMRLWIQTHVQTFVVIGRLTAPLGYFLLLLAIALGSARLFGSRWLAIPAIVSIGLIGPMPELSYRTAMESFYPAALVALAIFGFSGRRSAWSISELCMVSFWSALVISLKLVNLPFVLIFFYVLYIREDLELDPRTSNVHRLFESFTAWIFPIFLAAFAAGTWATKSAKISPRGVHVLITLMALCLFWVGIYSSLPRLRGWLRRQQTLCAAITLSVIQFFVINIPMSWKAWVGFLLNANEKFRWEVFVQYGQMMAMEPLILWSFGIALILWGSQCFRSSMFVWEERLPNSLCLTQAFPLYWFWIANYRFRNYNLLPLEILSALCAYSCLGYLWQLLQKRWSSTATDRFHPIALCLALTVFIPIFSVRGLMLSPQSALHRLGMSLRSLDHFRPEAFDQGLDARGQYTAGAVKYLWLANMYSAFHFPTDSTSNTRATK